MGWLVAQDGKKMSRVAPGTFGFYFCVDFFFEGFNPIFCADFLEGFGLIGDSVGSREQRWRIDNGYYEV